jgi:hypothetical protein
MSDANDSIAQAELSLALAVAAMDEAAGKIAQHKWDIDLAHITQETQFRCIIEKQEQDLAKSAERTQLEKQHNELLFRQRRLTEVDLEIRGLETERVEMRAKLSEVRDERFAIRHSVAERLNSRLNPIIRIRVAQSADQEDYRVFLETVLKEAGIQHKKVSASLSKEISPDELADLIKSNDVMNLANRGGISKQQAEAVIRELKLYGDASAALKTALPKLYVTLVARDCLYAKSYCVSLQGATLIAEGAPIDVYERAYLRPGDTTSAAVSGMLVPRMVSGGMQP